MVQVAIDIPADKVARVDAANRGTHPMPQIDDPDWVPPVDPDDMETAPKIDKYTSIEWFKLSMKQEIVKMVARWEQAQGKAAVPYVEDDTVVS